MNLRTTRQFQIGSIGLKVPDSPVDIPKYSKKFFVFEKVDLVQLWPPPLIWVSTKGMGNSTG